MAFSRQHAIADAVGVVELGHVRSNIFRVSERHGPLSEFSIDQSPEVEVCRGISPESGVKTSVHNYLENASIALNHRIKNMTMHCFDEPPNAVISSFNILSGPAS